MSNEAEVLADLQERVARLERAVFQREVHTRSARTGRYVEAEEAETNPDETVTES